MQENTKIYCHWDLLRFVKEEHLKEDGKYRTLSVTDGEFELMVFLEKTNSELVVTVYKASPTDKYIPVEDDNVTRYEETDGSVVFYFESFEHGISFIDWLGYKHKEFKVRPYQKINLKNR